MKRIAIASHIALIKGKEYDGIGNVLIETLGDIPADLFMVRHSMEGGLPSVVRNYSAGKIVKEHRLAVFRKPGPLRYVTEIIASVGYFGLIKKVDVYVGVNPLNAIAGVLLKKMGRVKQAIFYTPDYSPQRFSNQVLNRVYHAIDSYCVKHADEVWCVSARIQAVRREMGLQEEKNILVPNVPPEKFAPLQKNKRNRYGLITYGIVDKQLDSAGVIRAVAALKDTYPELNFTIVGNGPEEAALKKLAKELKVADRIIMPGRKPLDETLELASKAGIGLALYTGEWAFNTFGDSTKCREFFFFGLPVISTDSHATVEEIKQYNAGVIVPMSVDSYIEAIKTVLKNYDDFSEASARLGRKYAGIHKREIERLLTD